MVTTQQWRLLVATLPTRPAAARMRLWRSLKSLGCTVLRDGAWLLPAGVADAALTGLTEETRAAGGSAELLHLVAADEAQETRFRALFDRSADYARLLEAVRTALAGTPNSRTAHALRKDFKAIATTDYFPGEARRQAEEALTELAAVAGGEPRAAQGRIRRLTTTDFQARTWATRRHLWVDRMASAWLIRRFVDPQARFIWLDDPRQCPKDALGFDFDGATFSHLGSRVTFEVLATSFGLDVDPALTRIGTIVRCLDVGGVPVAEAPGIEAVLGGLRSAVADDDNLLKEASRIFDGLYDNYRQDLPHE